MAENKLKNMKLEEASDFWDEHDFFEFNDATEEKNIRFKLHKKKYVGLEENLYKRIRTKAKKLHTSVDKLVKDWLEKKVASL